MVSPRAAVVPLREEPREGAEQATQLLFGEPCTLARSWIRRSDGCVCEASGMVRKAGQIGR